MDDDYQPAQDPGGNRPGGDRVRFEVDEHGNEQGIFGGSAFDIEQSILGSTERNIKIIGKRILGVRDVVGDLGNGTLQELELHFHDGTTMTIRGIGMSVEIS